jgi:PAS domain S-box-containing protein
VSVSALRALLIRHSAQASVVAFCVLLVGSMWGGFALLVAHERDLIERNQFAQNLNLARAFEENVVRTLGAADEVLRDLQAGYRHAGRKFDIAEFARGRKEAGDPYTLFGIIDEHANVVVQEPMPARRLNLANNDNFNFHARREKDELFISTPRRGTTTGKWEFFVSRRINKADGSFGGFASVGLDTEYFAAIYNRIELGKDALIALVGRDGVIRARRTSAGMDAGQTLSRSSVFVRELLAKAEGHVIATSPVDGVTRLSSFVALRNYPLIVSVGTSEAVVLADFRHRRNVYAAVLAAVSLVVLGFAATVVSQLRRQARTSGDLRASEARLREAQQLARLGNWELDLGSGALRWSDEIYRIFEIDPAKFDASYEAFLGAIHPEDRELVNRAYTESVANRTGYAIVHRLRMPDGRIKHVQERGQTSYTEDGKPLRSVGTVQDVTALHEAERALRALNVELEARVEARTAELRQSLDELRAAQAQLVQSEKMAALGSLVAGIAHEINTPLGIGVTAASHVELAVRALNERFARGELTRQEMEGFLGNATEACEMVLANLQRAADLVRSFKQVAVDQSSGERRRFSLKPYLEEVLRSLGPQLRRTRHELLLVCPENLEIDSYPGAYSQIVTNLVLNSLTHGFDGIEQGRIEIEVLREGESLRLRYRDNGKGIAPEHLPKIFDPFFTTKRGVGGSGLGLHVLYNLVTQTLGGTIECRSKPGEGVSFEIDLPMRPPLRAAA